MSGRIIQFGTSRFLQAHAAFFVHEAAEAGQTVGPITVVQTSGDSSRSGRVAAFGRPEGYPVVIRGMSDGITIDRTVHVKSIDRGLSAASDWAEILRLFTHEAEFVVSNTGDTGYRTVPAEDRFSSTGDAPKSFPAKLAFLLFRRTTRFILAYGFIILRLTFTYFRMILILEYQMTIVRSLLGFD